MAAAAQSKNTSSSLEDEEGLEEIENKSTAKKSEALWMMTFADLSFILMCFFALLLSMSNVDTKKYDHIVEGIKKEKKDSTKSLEEIRKFIEKEIKRKKLSQQASVKLDSEGLAIEFKNKLLFKSGSAKTSRTFAKVSSKVLDIIAKSNDRYNISIEGHTDDTKVGRRSQFRSNWELSSARGISLLRLLHQKGVRKDRVRVIAYADTKPKVKVNKLKGKNLTRARAMNRRVVIRVQ